MGLSGCCGCMCCKICMKVTAANTHDATMTVELLTGEEAVYGDSGYLGAEKQTAKLNMLFALANLILADRRCLAA